MGKLAVRSGWALVFFLSLAAFQLFAPSGESSEPGETSSAEPVAAKPNAETVLTLTDAEQRKAGIVTAPLETTAHRKELRAFGQVLALQGLADLRSRYLEDKARLESALAKLEVSDREYKRLKRLNAENKNISDKALQAAAATRRIDAVNAAAAKETVPLLENKIELMWGDVIGQWLFEGSLAFQRLMQKKDVLIRITLQQGARVSPMPENIEIQGATGSRLTARLVSPAPETDPYIQGISFFYLAPPVEYLLAGMNVVAYVKAGPEQEGVLLPGSAVVWWQGAPWVYVQSSAEQFARRKVPTKNPFEDGYFVIEGFRKGEQVVIRGAQLLLSQEFRAQIQGGD